MKKGLMIVALLVLLATVNMAYTIGICAQNWSDFVCCEKVHGVYVSSTVNGYVSHGVLTKGDVITEAVVFPAYKCLGKCCPIDERSSCYDPCNPCKTTYTPSSYSFTACCSLESQLSQFRCVDYCYKKTWNQFALKDALNCLQPGQTVVMRVYRSTTCQWMIGVLSWNGNTPQLSLYPCQTSSCNPCQPCNPCKTVTTKRVTSVQVEVTSTCNTQPYTIEIVIE
ncbi:MAG: hypothetical protein ACOC34_03855 [Thermotogota bacterium]